MDFHALQERLRLELLNRIETGALTGAAVARQAGFQQAHVSNFLNKKRSLSLDGLDRVLQAINLTVIDLLPEQPVLLAEPEQIDTEFSTVPVIGHGSAAQQARPPEGSILENVQIPSAVLDQCRARPSQGRALWQRFVAIRVNAPQAISMAPVLVESAIVIIDRHYNSMAHYRSQQHTFHAVFLGSLLHIGLVDYDAERLVVRPLNASHPIQLVTLGPQEQPSDFIVGRVCYMSCEL